MYRLFTGEPLTYCELFMSVVERECVEDGEEEEQEQSTDLSGVSTTSRSNQKCRAGFRKPDGLNPYASRIKCEQGLSLYTNWGEKL